MKLHNLCILTFFCVGLFMQQAFAQQTEVEYDSGVDNPQLRLTETGAGTAFVRLQMQNQLSGHWTIATRNGSSSDFNIFHENAAGVGLNYINIDATDEIINLNFDVEINDADLTINGPDPDLVLSSDAGTDPAILFGDNGGTGDGRIWYDSDRDVMKFGTSTIQGAINANASGKVGFDIDRFSSVEELNAQVTIKANSGNTTTPAHLELYENNNSGFPNIQFTNFNRDAYWEVQAGSEQSSTLDGFMHFVHSDDATSPEQIMTINGSQERIGIVDPTPEYTLSVDHASGSPNAPSGPRNGFNIENTANNDSWTFYTSSTSGDLRIYYDATTGAGAVPILRGAFSAINGTYNNFSDIRLKKNISILENQLDKVMQLRPTRYQIRGQEGDEYSLGLIAQEVQNIVPEVVSQMSDKGDDKNYLGIAYSELIPVLIGAIQDQQDIINAQKFELANVRTELNTASASLRSEMLEMIKAELSKEAIAEDENSKNAKK